MAEYIIRDIPETLWARVKARSKSDGIPIKAVVTKCLEMYARGELVIKADYANGGNHV